MCSNLPYHTWCECEFWGTVGTVLATDTEVWETLLRMTLAINSARLSPVATAKTSKSCNSYLCEDDHSPSSLIVLKENAFPLKHEHETCVSLRLHICPFLWGCRYANNTTEAVMQTTQLLVSETRNVNKTTPCFWGCTENNTKHSASLSGAGIEPCNKPYLWSCTYVYITEQFAKLSRPDTHYHTTVFSTTQYVLVLRWYLPISCESLQIQRACRMGYTPTTVMQPASHQPC